MKTAWKAVLVAGVLSSMAFGAEVDRREANQQERIGQGVESGQLTPHETVRLERKETRVQKEIASDRAANGGKLTPGEKASVNRQQNRISRQIDRQKHDAQTAR